MATSVSPRSQRDAGGPLRTRGLFAVAAGIACGLWGSLALAVGAGMLALVVVDRAGLDADPQPLLYRLVGLAWMRTTASGAMRSFGLAIDPQSLGYFLNRDFDDALLLGSALAALTLGAGALLIGHHVTRGRAWAGYAVAVASRAAVAALAAVGVCLAASGAPAGALAAIAGLASVPAAFAVASRPAPRAESPEAPADGRRRHASARPALLTLLAIHALLLVPALGWAWVLTGIALRQAWLNWTQ